MSQRLAYVKQEDRQAGIFRYLVHTVRQNQPHKAPIHYLVKVVNSLRPGKWKAIRVYEHRYASFTLF